MTAEEYVVEKLSKTEADFEKVKTQNEALVAELCSLRELKSVIIEHFTVNEYSVGISLKKYESAHLRDIKKICAICDIDIDLSEEEEEE
jgi:hypothetical protein